MPHTCIQPLYDIIHLNSFQMLEAIEQFDENKASQRILGGGKNSFKFILGHIIWDRCQMSRLIGEPQNFSWLDKFASGQTHSDGSDYPSLTELGIAYKELADFLESKLDSLTEETLMQSTENAFPEQEKTIRGGIAFWVWQDCYHMGQTGSILTTLGLTDIKTLYHKKKTSLSA